MVGKRAAGRAVPRNPPGTDRPRVRLSVMSYRARWISLVLASCADAPRNPPVLWLGLDGAETQVTLIDHDPPPY